jgi:hypothetical protein
VERLGRRDIETMFGGLFGNRSFLGAIGGPVGLRHLDRLMAMGL